MEPFDFVNRENAEYLDRLYEQYRRDPRSVSQQWQVFFAGFELGLNRFERAADAKQPQVLKPSEQPAAPDEDGHPLSMGIFDLVHTFREVGHFTARLDPLGHDRSDHRAAAPVQFRHEPGGPGPSGRPRQLPGQDRRHVTRPDRKAAAHVHGNVWRRVLWNFGQGAARLAGRANGADLQPPAALPARAKADSFSTPRRRRFRAIFCTPATSGRSDFRSRAANR